MKNTKLEMKNNHIILRGLQKMWVSNTPNISFGVHQNSSRALHFVFDSTGINSELWKCNTEVESCLHQRTLPQWLSFTADSHSERCQCITYIPVASCFIKCWEQYHQHKLSRQDK